MSKYTQVLGLGFLFLVSPPVLFAKNPPPAKIVYSKPLEIKRMKLNPMAQLMDWYQAASQKIGRREAATFTLATVSQDCKPSTRSMMAKNIDQSGFSFIGDLQTQKFEELKSNPNAAITFYWRDEQRQINLTGTVRLLSREEAEEIFKDRAFTHQIASLLSKEFKDAKSNAEKWIKYTKTSKRYQGKAVPLPDTWGGYRFIPEKVEFWQRGTDNLHSRITYIKNSDGVWEKKELF